MRKIYLLLIFALLSPFVRGQYVNIPDPQFRAWLINNGLSGCITGTQMDTTCAAVVEFDTISIGTNIGLTNLEGIQYFRKLRLLKISSNNNFTTVPQISDSVRTIVLFNCNGLNTLSNIPPFTQIVNVSFSPLNSLPQLPSSLISLDCRQTQIQALPPLPVQLRELLCDNLSTPFTYLSDSLKIFDCTFSKVSPLPSFPTGLLTLSLSSDSLTSIPALPPSLKRFSCNGNFLSTLPTLPMGLDTLEFSWNALPGLPQLPPNLITLSCAYDSLYNLPPLPHKLKILACEGNLFDSLFIAGCDSLVALGVSDDSNLVFIDSFPPNLASVYLVNNHLSHLPQMQHLTDLEVLHLSYNRFQQLPLIPANMELLVDHNQLVDLGFMAHPYQTTPIGYGYIDASYNNIGSSYGGRPVMVNNLEIDHNPNLTNLGPITKVLTMLHASYTALDYDAFVNGPMTTTIDLPSESIILSNNPFLECLPPLPSTIDYLDFSNTDVQCLSQSINAISVSPSLSTLPYCDYIFNPNNCPFDNIRGSVFNDANGNCFWGSGEVSHPNVKVQLYSGTNLVQQMYTTQLGDFSFRVQPGTYTLKIDSNNAPIYQNCPSSSFSVPSAFAISQSPAYKCKPGFNLKAQNVVHTTGLLFPGLYANFKLMAGDAGSLSAGNSVNTYNICPANVPAEIRVVLSGPAEFAANIIPAPTYINADTILWQVANISTFPSPVISVRLDTLAIIGQHICFNVLVSTNAAGENNLSDNFGSFCYPVINSYDPNEKEVTPKRSMAPGEWLTYTLHFQNTGNAPALNIRILDTLSSSLDYSTFQLLDYDHTCVVQLLDGGIAQFSFPNINLPDSASNPAGSKGYVQFRIRIKSGLPTGFVITNKASIYFDYNAPIVTNTVVSKNCTNTPAVQNSNIEICAGASYYFAGNLLTSSGTYKDTLRTFAGCDSLIRVLTLSLLPTSTAINQNICAGTTYQFNGINLTTTGTYYDTLQNAAGCDSIITLNLTVLNTSATSFTQSICSGETYNFNGTQLTSSGTYYDTLQNAVGCDSIITLNLQVDTLPLIIADANTQFTCTNYGPVTFTAWGAETYVWSDGIVNNVPYTPAGEGTYNYVVTGTDGNGCVSTDTIAFLVAQGTEATIFTSPSSGSDGAITVNVTAGSPPFGVSCTGANGTTNEVIFDSTGTAIIDSLPPGNYLIYISGNFPWCALSETVDVLTVGINGLADNRSFTLMPNPANSSVIVSLADGGSGTLQLFSSVGQLVLQQTIEQNNTTLDISTLSQGIYFVQVNTAKGIGVKKLVVQR